MDCVVSWHPEPIHQFSLKTVRAPFLLKWERALPHRFLPVEAFSLCGALPQQCHLYHRSSFNWLLLQWRNVQTAKADGKKERKTDTRATKFCLLISFWCTAEKNEREFKAEKVFFDHGYSSAGGSSPGSSAVRLKAFVWISLFWSRCGCEAIWCSVTFTRAMGICCGYSTCWTVAQKHWQNKSVLMVM